MKKNSISFILETVSPIKNNFIKMKEKRKKLQIFNLEFPDYINELKIGDYLFKRVKDYKKAFEKMMQSANCSGPEFEIKRQTGSHQITATVELPEKEKKCALPFSEKNLKQLDDILFLFTILTDRNVFKKDWDDSKDIVMTGDHGIRQYGRQLILSVKSESRWENIETEEIKTDKEIEGIQMVYCYYHQIDIGFENTVNKVLNLISSKKWQDEYEGGYFLFLFKAAIQRQILETSFITCWTIWEHIFTIKNRKWLDHKTIEQMSGDKKIAFILNKYFLKNIDDTARKNIQKINQTRNRLVHFGKKTDQIDYKEMEMFVRLTEQLIAVILELSPSNSFGSFEQSDSFLKAKNCKK